MPLSPDVTELLTDPELGGGLEFTVIRKTTRNTIDGRVTEVTTIKGTGNIQPPSAYDLQLTHEEQSSEPMIVIRSTTEFSMGSNNGTGSVYCEPDEVVAMGKRWKIKRLDDWSAWGFTSAWFTLMKDGDVDAELAGAR